MPSSPFPSRIARLASEAIAIAALTALGACAPAARAAPDLPLDARSSVEFKEHYQRGLELYRQGLLEGALAEFKECLEIDPEVADLQFQVGRILMERALNQGARLDIAADRLEHALRLDSKNTHARLLLAVIYRHRYPPGMYDPDRASALYEELLKANPDWSEIRVEYAKWLLDGEVRLRFSGDPNRVPMDSAWSLEIARSQFETLLDQSPPGTELVKIAQGYIGEILMRLGDYDGSKKRLEHVLATYALPRESKARALQKIGYDQLSLDDVKGAAATFRKAYEADPQVAYLWDLRIAFDRPGGYPDDLPAEMRFQMRKDGVDPANPPLLKFKDAAPSLGIDKWAGAGPSAWADVDGDGREDLLACGCDTFCTLWKNNGTTFTDITLKAGLGKLESGFGAVFADYDNDGDQDFYVARNGWNGPAPNSLMRNNGDGTFTDVTAAARCDAGGSSFNAAWADFNGDGWLDLLVSQGVTNDGSVNRLFYGNGDGTFRDVTEKSGILDAPRFGTIGIAVGDYDGDGWPDIFVHGRFSPNHLFHNEHDGTFKDVAKEAGVQGTSDQNGYVAFFSDVDADGDLDIVTGSLAEWNTVIHAYRAGWQPKAPADLADAPHFYRNDGGGRFSDQSRAAGLTYPYGIMSGGVADLDNDGYPDFYFGTGDPSFTRLEPNVLLHNVEGKRFDDVSRYAGVDSLAKGHGISFIDWDGDGDLDIYIELGGFYHGDFAHSAFYLNQEGSRNGWLEITLEQPGLNRDAVGAGVTLRDGAYRLYQEVKRGEGFGSTNPLRLHFGLGKRARVEALEIRWPDGSRQTLPDPPIRRRLRVRKGEIGWRVE
jgi:tetratricopeptide (TPR) repeat protein